MSNKFVKITAVTDATPLAQAFIVSGQIDSANKTITGLKGGIYSRIRREARNIYEEHLKRAGGDLTQLMPEAMRAQFRQQMDAAETGDKDKAGKGTWGQNKTNLARALGLGFNFVADPEVGASALSTWCKDVDDAAQEKADAEAAAAYRKANGLSEAPKADVPPTAGNPAPAAPTASQGVSDAPAVTFATPEQETAFDTMMKLIAEISEQNPAELERMIVGFNGQLVAKKAKLIKLAAMPMRKAG